LFCGLALLVFLSLLAGSLVQKRSQALAEAARTTHNLARTLDEQATGNIRERKIVLDGLAERITEELGEGTLEPQLAQRILATRFKHGIVFEDVAILDADGHRIADLMERTAPLDLSDRDFFNALRSAPTDDFYISRPFFLGASKRWCLGLSRPLRRSDGSFVGVVVATIDLQVFQAFYASLDLGERGNVTLWDGRAQRVLARYPSNPALFNVVFDRRTLYDAIIAGSGRATLQAKSPIDGVDRIISFRRVSELPLIVSVGLSSDDVLTAWRRDLWSHGIGAAIGSIVVIVLAGLVLDQFGRLRASEASVRASEQRFRDFVETASDFYWETDAQHRFTSNSTGLRLPGGIAEEPIGMRMDEAVRVVLEDVGRMAEHVARRDRHESFSNVVFGLQTQSGEICYRSVSGKPFFDRNGNFMGYRGSGRDVTEQRRSEARLSEAKATAEAASRAKSQFLAGMSHELRTPLNAIIGFSDLLLSETFGKLTNPKTREYLSDIHSSGQHLLKIINDILEVSRIEAGQVELHEEVFDVGEIIETCLRFVRQRALSGGVRLHAGSTEGLPHLHADATRLKQILLNLLSNGVKFTPRGGEVSVVVSLNGSGDMEIAVQDSGIGMSEAEIDIALQPFRQVDSSLARRYEGTGLGLPLTTAFVEAHGGRLVIESIPGEGTTARIILPAARLRPLLPSVELRAASSRGS
jgi:PAS domain S-box-containing protein